MARFYLELARATNIKRNENGVPWTWTHGKKIKDFTSADDFMDYVKEHASDLVDAVAFSGGAHTGAQANTFLTEELQRQGVLDEPTNEGN